MENPDEPRISIEPISEEKEQPKVKRKPGRPKLPESEKSILKKLRTNTL